MLSCFDFFREMTYASIFARLIAAFVCGGLIGLERELKRRPAGFRTHILISLGAAMTMLTGQYLFLTLGLYTDIGRLGAQVIAGIGFIGAGSILVTKNRRVKGLTTAAGLWSGAIIGLACGAGYVECAVFATCMILLAELLLIKIEYGFRYRGKDLALYIEYESAECIRDITRLFRFHKVKVEDLEISMTQEPETAHFYCAIFSLQLTGSEDCAGLIPLISDLPGVLDVEEM